MHDHTKCDFMWWVALSLSIPKLDKIVSEVNRRMQQKRESIDVARDYHFDLSLDLMKTGQYQLNASIGGKDIPGLGETVCEEFTTEHFLKFYMAVRDRVPETWEKDLERDIRAEIAGVKLNYKLRWKWFGKTLPLNFKGKGNLTRWFDITMSEHLCHGVSQTKFDIKHEIAHIPSTLGNYSLVTSMLEDSWFQHSVSFLGPNAGYYPGNDDYHKGLLIMELTSQIKQMVLCAEL